jgi:hypothetical protein
MLKACVHSRCISVSRATERDDLSTVQPDDSKAMSAGADGCRQAALGWLRLSTAPSDLQARLVQAACMADTLLSGDMQT